MYAYRSALGKIGDDGFEDGFDLKAYDDVECGDDGAGGDDLKVGVTCILRLAVGPENYQKKI